MVAEAPLIRQRQPGEESVNRVVNYKGDVSLADIVFDIHGPLPLVHRTEYHEDGSQSDEYYLELAPDQYLALASKFPVRVEGT